MKKLNGKIAATAIKKLVRRLGSDKRVAKALGMNSAGPISHWKGGRRPVPKRHHPRIKELLTDDNFDHNTKRHLLPGMKIWISHDEYITILNPSESLKVQTLRAGKDEFGFQRPLSPSKYEEIEFRIQTCSWLRLPGIMLAEVNGVLYDLDGQHRRIARIISKTPVLAHVIVCNFSDARKNFALHGTKATRIPRNVMLKGADGDNAVATQIMNLAREFEAHEDQVLTLMHGIVIGNGSASNSNWFSVIDDNAKLLDADIERARVILSVWTSSEYWNGLGDQRSYQEKKDGGAFSCIGTMRAIGIVARDYKDMDRLRRAMQSLSRPSLWKKSSKLHVDYDSQRSHVEEVTVVHMRRILNKSRLAEKKRLPVKLSPFDVLFEKFKSNIKGAARRARSALLEKTMGKS